MDRITYCIGNWKMNFDNAESKIFLDFIRLKLERSSYVKAIICPPFTLLRYFNEVDLDGKIEIGAQNLYPGIEGPFTGEISAFMLNDISCQWCIIGHSERRKLFNEDNDLILKKLNQCIDNKINPILCIGESLEDREKNNTYKKLSEQIIPVFSSIDLPEDLNLVIAYEPVWAIGTGLSATSDIIYETHSMINDILHNINFNKHLSILYGGSVDSKNAKELLKVSNLDGFLIGGASLNAEEFCNIYHECEERKR